jgi:hypothetical protein
VAGWFLRVGAASGTVAKTISAYDKIVSDEIYGAGTRYVSKERLVAMLEHEYELLLERLSTTRSEDTRFFVFAETVAAHSYRGGSEEHGWMGIRFQAEPSAPPSQLLLHINLGDPTAQLQQQAIGILGVNLVYAVFHQRSDVKTFLAGLFDDLSAVRIEIDVIRFDGPAFVNQDSRKWCLELLRCGMAHAVVFDESCSLVEPSSVLRKRALLLMRRRFSDLEPIDRGLFLTAKAHLVAEDKPLEREPAALVEVTTHPVSGVESLSVDQMLEWIQKQGCREPVVVTDFPETYLLSRYLRRHSTEPVRFIVSAAAAAKTMHEAFYTGLPGTLLEGLGRLLATNVKLYVTPMRWDAFRTSLGDLSSILEMKSSSNDLVTLDDLTPSGPSRYLFEYLRSSGRLVALEHAGRSRICS